MKQLFLTMLLLLAAGTRPALADNLTVGGQTRSYNVYAPKNLGENRPLLIFCHGYNQDANWMQNSEFKNDKVSMEAVCDTAKFVVVFPNGIDKAWDTSGDRDINFIKAIIDKMVTQHKIDRSRVYLGGFSMGGMLTYHAMNKIPDLIAAFCPVSGYPMGGATANAKTRAIPILHTHGTGDETCGFSGMQPALNVWIKHNGCPTTAKTVKNYNGLGLATRHTWGPGNDGVEVVLLELAGKGHWVSKEDKCYTGAEIWKFCKKYSLNMTKPHVSITSPKAGLSYTSLGASGMATFPDITMTATADDSNGQVVKVDFYDGSTLVGTATKSPYKVTLTGLKSGKHTLKAVATDNDGETSTATTELTLTGSTTMALSSTFTEANSVPAGWTTYDSDEKRVGYANGFGQGCRILEMTGSKKDFRYGLYVRNKNGKHNAGYAKYGLTGTDATLSLAPGHYVMKYKIYNWNRPEFAPVTVAIENRAGTKSLATQEYTPTVNIGNTASNSFNSVVQQSFEFDITDQGDYAVAVYAADSEWSDFIIGQLSLTYQGAATGIQTVAAEPSTSTNQDVTYDLQGRRVADKRPGLYIRNGKKLLVK